MPCPTLEVQIKSFVPLPAWCIGDVTLGTGQTDSIFPGTEMTRRSILLPWTTFTVLLKEAPRNNRTLEQGHEKGQGGWEVSASLWDLQRSAASTTPQWKRYFLAGLRLMYVAFISSASGFRTSLNRSPLVLTTWLSMYRISFLGACQAIRQ